MAVLMEAESQQTWTHQNLAMHALTNLSAEPTARSAMLKTTRLGDMVRLPSRSASPPRAHLPMTVRLVQVTAVLRMSPHQPFALHLILSLSSDTSTAAALLQPAALRALGTAAAARGDGQALALQATVNLSCSGADAQVGAPRRDAASKAAGFSSETRCCAAPRPARGPRAASGQRCAREGAPCLCPLPPPSYCCPYPCLHCRLPSQGSHAGA